VIPCDAGRRERIEELVASYLDRRERDPALSPERFAATLGADADAVLAGIRGTLGVVELLGAAAQEARPERIGPYRVLEELGRGAMGVVYAVEREGTRHALKLWSPSWTLSAHARERFQREARTLARLDHPGIVRVHDAGIDARCPYLVMELVEGEPLSRLRAPLEPARAARIVRDLARAVEVAHQAGALHRDIKPQNVVLRGDDQPVLLDFGLVAAEGEETLTATGALLGTPRYMAPEQARGLPAERRTDVHALGLVLYELLYGAPARDEGSPSALLRSAARLGVRLPRRQAGVDRDLERVLSACLAWRPERRLATAGALARDLERWLAGEPVEARPPSRAARLLDRARAQPARVAWTGALVAALLLGSGLWQRGLARAAARSREVAEEHADAALGAWFLGGEEVARRELDASLAADRAHPVAEALDRALRGEPAAGAGDVALAAAALAAGDGERAAALLERTSEHPPLASLASLRARALALAGRSAEAAVVRDETRRRFPACATVVCLDALAHEHAGDGDAADAALRSAIERRPDSGPLHAERARVLLRLGRIEEGVGEASEAARLHLAQGIDFQLELSRILSLAADESAVRAELEARLARDPDSSSLWFALAWSRDCAHDLAGAEAAYRGALDADPQCLRAALNLAHLYAGAQLGSCRACDEAFAREPELLSWRKSLEALRVALRIDLGRSDFAPGRMVQTALDLARRAPEARAADVLAVAIEEVLANGPADVAARARLEDAARRLRAAGGD